MTSNPVPQINTAEALLVEQVKAITAAIGTVAGGPLDAALADLTRAATEATDRVEGVRQFIADALRPLLCAFANLSGDLAMGRAVNLGGESVTTAGEQKTTPPAPPAIGCYPYPPDAPQNDDEPADEDETNPVAAEQSRWATGEFDEPTPADVNEAREESALVGLLGVPAVNGPAAEVPAMGRNENGKPKRRRRV